MRGRNIVGEKFGMLTVLEEIEAIPRKDKPGWKRRRFRCVCDCGNITEVNRDCLVGGNTKSCGCMAKKNIRKAIEKETIHGKTNTRLYRIWSHMKDRCYRPGNNRYQYYGGRGIDVCEEWKNNFTTFYDWAMANGYKENLSIDRIDNDKGYSPENCRWADAITQSRNRRNIKQGGE